MGRPEPSCPVAALSLETDSSPKVGSRIVLPTAIKSYVYYCGKMLLHETPGQTIRVWRRQSRSFTSSLQTSVSQPCRKLHQATEWQGEKGTEGVGECFFSIKVVGFDIFCISLPVRFIKIYTLNLFVCRSNSVCVIFERFDCLVGRGFLL